MPTQQRGDGGLYSHAARVHRCGSHHSMTSGGEVAVTSSVDENAELAVSEAENVFSDIVVSVVFRRRTIIRRALGWLMCQKVFGTMCSCLHGQAQRYLTDLCIPVYDVSAWQHLRSATRRFFWWFRYAGSAHLVHGPSLRPARCF